MFNYQPTPGMPQMIDSERVSLKTVLWWVMGHTMLIGILTFFLVMLYMDNREMRKRIDACNDTQIQALQNVVKNFTAFLQKKDTDKIQENEK